MPLGWPICVSLMECFSLQSWVILMPPITIIIARYINVVISVWTVDLFDHYIIITIHVLSFCFTTDWTICMRSNCFIIASLTTD